MELGKGREFQRKFFGEWCGKGTKVHVSFAGLKYALGKIGIWQEGLRGEECGVKIGVTRAFFIVLVGAYYFLFFFLVVLTINIPLRMK